MNIEIVSFKTSDGVLVSAVDLACNDDLLPVRPFEIRAKTDTPATSVARLPDLTPVAFENADGHVIFRTDEVPMFGMYKINTATGHGLSSPSLTQ